MNWVGSDDSRTRFLNWQNRVLRYILLSFAVSIIVIVASTYYVNFNKTQREYLPDYIKASIFSNVFTTTETNSKYTTKLEGRNKQGNIVSPRHILLLPDKEAYQIYYEQVFEKKSLSDWGKFPGLALGLTSFVGILGLALVIDYRSQKAREKGKLLRGPQLVSPKEFSKLWPLVGQKWHNKILIQMGLKPGPEKGLKYNVFNDRDKIESLVLPLEAEVRHMAILGATGTGKSVFLKQTLEEIAKRGEPAVVYDPVGEMAEIFFRAERGDQI